MNPTTEPSESLQIGILLALAGGFMDAYSYVCRDRVFANAQTGNLLLIGIHLWEGSWVLALRYLCPVLAFVAGIALADTLRASWKGRGLHWRQAVLVAEAVTLCLVAFFPQQLNLLANSLTSLACGIQVESFRRINGDPISTTMCIGNLRTATQAACEFARTRDKTVGRRSLIFYGAILFFMIGAVMGNACVQLLREKAIILCGLILLLVALLISLEQRRHQPPRNPVTEIKKIEQNISK